MGNGKRGKYTLQFKQEAVRLAGVGPEHRRDDAKAERALTEANWIKAQREGRLKEVPGKRGISAEQMEISRLRGGSGAGKMERDVLGKSTAYFARGQNLGDHAKAAIEVITGFLAAKPGSGPPSNCEPYRELIARELECGHNAMGIWQDLVDRHGFAGGYQSVRRFVRNMGGAAASEARTIIETRPGVTVTLKIPRFTVWKIPSFDGEANWHPAPGRAAGCWDWRIGWTSEVCINRV